MGDEVGRYGRCHRELLDGEAADMNSTVGEESGHASFSPLFLPIDYQPCCRARQNRFRQLGYSGRSLALDDACKGNEIIDWIGQGALHRPFLAKHVSAA
jgi:hypothetical protein